MEAEFGFVSYNSHHYGRAETTMGCSVHFVNLLPYTVAMFWDDGTPAGRPQGFIRASESVTSGTVSYTHLRAHETPEHLVCRLLLEKKKKDINIRRIVSTTYGVYNK
eukprot:TRINITY_DN21786_c0_g1_i1.p1 TRINITY_DN21786_c0_g1~~TRINITY_DN21786_c0_g1_i1.p1  ORF type:complete len:107 (-),score=15.16 TRINITY_DN21786_c0_g1_i1:17-337(-)